MQDQLVFSVQAFLKLKGFDPGALDGVEGPKTLAAWNAFLNKEEPQPAPKPVQFQALGSAAPIRGQFSITVAQMEALCTGVFAKYALYAEAIVEDSAKYSINPLFVLADLVNQGTNPAYRNPWGISTDNYPYGPNGSQLGKSNAYVKDGPRSFGLSEWRIAFDRQFSVVATGKAYAGANTIAEWAKIDAPAGADNDVNGTNAEEGVEVGALYNKLVTKLTTLS